MLTPLRARQPGRLDFAWSGQGIVVCVAKSVDMNTLRTFSAALTLSVALATAPGMAAPKSPAADDSKPDIHGTIVPHAAGVTLGAKDFLADLPDEVREDKVVSKTAVIKIDKKVKFDVTVHYDQLVNHPSYYRRAEVTMAEKLPGVTVGVVFGFPINLGTREKPMMAVPFTLQWSGDGWLRGDQWTLYADGRLERTE